MPNHSRVAVALDAAPTAQELLAAQAAGMTLVAWRAAGKPISGIAATKSASSRPFAPYRNKWESQYGQHLEIRKIAGDRVLGPIVENWAYEPDRLQIGIGAFFKPDFRVDMRLGTQRWRERHEVKGHRREAAIVRIKAAALRYPDQRFVLVTKKNGQWEYTPIGAKP